MGRPRRSPTRREVEVKAEDLPELADVLPGGRNTALFHHVRHYAYRQVAHHDKFLTFADDVTDFASSCRDQLLDVEGFPESEAEGIAHSLATWTWAIFARNGGGQRPDTYHVTAPARRPAPSDAGYRGDPALNADSEVQRYRRSYRTKLDEIRVTGRIQVAAARSVTGWPVARVATTLGVSQRQAQRYLAAADLPSKRQAKRTLAVQQAKARRHDGQQVVDVDSGTGTLTGSESTRTRNGRWPQEQSYNGTVRAAETTPSREISVEQDAPRRPP